MHFRELLVGVSVAIAAAGCDAPARHVGDTLTGPAPAPSLLQDGGMEITVSRVRVFLKDGRPQAYVEAPLGGGCTTLDPVTQRRDGRLITVTMTATREEGVPCTMIFKYVNEWVPLPGDFDAGLYTVRVNGTMTEFRLVTDASGERRVEPDPGVLPELPPPTPGAASPDGPSGGSHDPGQIPGAPGGQR